MKHGKVVYTKNPESEKQLYIIAQWHRDPRHGLSGEGVAKVQTEIFRIIEYLHTNKNVGLILDEGLCAEEDYSKPHKFKDLDDEVIRTLKHNNVLLKELKKSDGAIEKILSTPNTKKLDAAALLRQTYGIDIQGAEAADVHSYLIFKSQLHGKYPRDLPEEVFMLRKAQLLINAPKVIEREFEAGHILNRKASMTIGSDNIDYMIELLEKEKITIDQFITDDGMRFGGMDCELALLEKKYGITVIIPNSISYNLPDNIKSLKKR